MEYETLKPEHILDAAKAATERVLYRWRCLRPYADEVASESLLAATKAAIEYPSPPLLFTYGLRYAVDRIIRAMKVQRWLPCKDEMTVMSWSVTTEDYDCSDVGACIPIESTVEELLIKMGKSLNPRSVDMVWRHCIEDETLESIGDSYGVCKERVRQIINKGKEKLKSRWTS